MRRVAGLLRQVVAVLEESPDYPNRRDGGVRRYVSVLVDDRESGDQVALRDGSAPLHEEGR